MQTIDIETAQNVVVQHEVASVGDRAVAYLLDSLVLVAWVLLCLFVGSFIELWKVGGSATGILAIVFVLLPFLFYHLVCELTMDGQSIGKRARKIRVARVDGGQPTLGQYLIRWILRAIDGFYWIGFVVILINGKGQRLGDIAAGTTVVTLKRRLSLQDTLITRVEEGHVVRIPEAVRLNDAQARMIREVLNAKMANSKVRVVEEMADKVRKVIGNEGVGIGSKVFLETVLRDYVFLTGQQTTNP
ncbi:MAG: RDD family protein [Flavobacteriales bacterium]|nr:RDD family protein [Flavobacteriales bacterium]MBK6945475.1 RDD family protein [Flavobacteriales bacterium]MBK7241588.1 RDD family protein [Flavobacteriales bacterium]MBK7296426.1 RDD family protein [Flavobacteriales bacterium]MBK9534971.1 RDD family protein [Flavobacteriales bacterium]